MLNEKIRNLMNEQINKELFSGYLYLEMANFCEDQGLSGFAKWYTIQAAEERDHALIFRNFLLENGCRVTLDAIAKPEPKLENVMDVVNAGLKHEQYVTSLINNIYDEAFATKDYKSMEFLNWFVKEQVEEEDNAENLIKMVEVFGKDANGLYNINKELGKREYHTASKLKED